VHSIENHGYNNAVIMVCSILIQLVVTAEEETAVKDETVEEPKAKNSYTRRWCD
jgi:hypothetical protein